MACIGGSDCISTGWWCWSGRCLEPHKQSVDILSKEESPSLPLKFKTDLPHHTIRKNMINNHDCKAHNLKTIKSLLATKMSLFRGVTLAFRSLACLYPDLFLQKAQLSQNGARECGQSCSYLFKILRLLDKKGRKDERKEGKGGKERERERREGEKGEKNGDLSSITNKCDIMDITPSQPWRLGVRKLRGGRRRERKKKVVSWENNSVFWVPTFWGLRVSNHSVVTPRPWDLRWETEVTHILGPWGCCSQTTERNQALLSAWGQGAS